jgi:hypothetical protein
MFYRFRYIRVGVNWVLSWYYRNPVWWLDGVNLALVTDHCGRMFRCKRKACLYKRYILSKVWQDCVVGVLIGLWVRQLGARFLAGARAIYFFQHVQTVSVAHLTFCWIGSGVSSRRYNGRGLKLTTHLHPVPTFNLTVDGLVYLIRLFAFMALTDRTSLL